MILKRVGKTFLASILISLEKVFVNIIHVDEQFPIISDVYKNTKLSLEW